MKENKLWEKSPFWQPSTKKIIYNFPTGNVQVLWVSGFFLAFSLSLTFSSSSLVSQSAALTLGWQKLDTSTEEWSFLHWSGSRWEPTIWKVHFETGINFLQHAICLIFSVRWELAPQRLPLPKVAAGAGCVVVPAQGLLHLLWTGMGWCLVLISDGNLQVLYHWSIKNGTGDPLGFC